MDKVAEPLPIDSTGNVLRRIAAASSVVLLIDARLIALDVACTVICSVSGKLHPHSLDLTYALGMLCATPPRTKPPDATPQRVHAVTNGIKCFAASH